MAAGFLTYDGGHEAAAKKVTHFVLLHSYTVMQRYSSLGSAAMATRDAFLAVETEAC